MTVRTYSVVASGTCWLKVSHSERHRVRISENDILFFMFELQTGHYFVFNICLFSCSLKTYSTMTTQYYPILIDTTIDQFYEKWDNKKLIGVGKKISCLWRSASIYQSRSLKGPANPTHLLVVYPKPYNVHNGPFEG